MAIESVDLANCYNVVAHPIASIALQSFNVCKVMVAMMLYVLKTMNWYLKTAFSQSKISFGGTALDPSMGLGQGNGVAPRGFLAVCTLMMNVYRNLGHGVKFIGAWAQDAFTLAADLYIDDSDLFHMAIGTPSDEEFLQLVQNATNNWAGLVHATGSCSNYRNASGICLVGYGRRARHASRPFKSCHGTHSTYLSRKVQGFRYV
jgi:hypothetical protein